MSTIYLVSWKRISNAHHAHRTTKMKRLIALKSITIRFTNETMHVNRKSICARTATKSNQTDWLDEDTHKESKDSHSKTFIYRNSRIHFCFKWMNFIHMQCSSRMTTECMVENNATNSWCELLFFLSFQNKLCVIARRVHSTNISWKIVFSSSVFVTFWNSVVKPMLLSVVCLSFKRVFVISLISASALKTSIKCPQVRIAQ